MDVFSTRNAPAGLINSVIRWCPEILELEGAIIAGGFIRAWFAKEQPRDLDLYFETEDNYIDALDTLENAGWEEVFKTDKAVSYMKNGHKTQVISFQFGQPIDIISHFDYTICAAALQLNIQNSDQNPDNPAAEGKLIIHHDFFEHLAGRILWYTGMSPLPLSSLKRVIKYTHRGYNISDTALVKIAQEISDKVDFNDAESVRIHTEGIGS